MRPCSFAFAGCLYYKMCVGLNGFNHRNNLALGGVRIGMGCMNLVYCYLKVYTGTRNLNLFKYLT